MISISSVVITACRFRLNANVSLSIISPENKVIENDFHCHWGDGQYSIRAALVNVGKSRLSGTNSHVGLFMIVLFWAT